MGKVAILPTSDLWTPSFTYDTPGDMAATYSTRVGTIDRLGGMALVSFHMVTSAFTFTTATGNLRLTLPFTVRGTGVFEAPIFYRGITKASFTEFIAQALGGLNYINVLGMGSGLAPTVVTAADTPSGGIITFRGSILIPIS